jgi:hypothetical protein
VPSVVGRRREGESRNHTAIRATATSSKCRDFCMSQGVLARLRKDRHSAKTFVPIASLKKNSDCCLQVRSRGENIVYQH